MKFIDKLNIKIKAGDGGDGGKGEEGGDGGKGGDVYLDIDLFLRTLSGINKK